MDKLVFAVCLVSCASEPRQPATIPAARSAPFPALAYPLLDGGTWSSSAAAGRLVVLDVWATHCKPCRKAFPKLNRIAATFPDVEVIGLSVDENDADVRAFLAQVPAAFPIARDPKLTIKTGPLAVYELPTVLVVDRAGRIRVRAEKLVEADYDRLFDVISSLRAE